ncbi:MAG: efflux RND transporter periplasmic adaptor subunit [Afipia sp.]|nr:efflux RND transporter periplasmic adaptor subunit [Afipia sp.]
MIVPATALAQQPAPAPAVLVQPAEERSLDRQFEFIGRVYAPEKVDLRARVQGFLGARQFKDGDEVKEGQVLFRIEREPFEAAVAQREAQLASAKATLENAELQLQRAQELIKTQAVPQATLDTRTTEVSKARAGVMEAQAALRDAQISLSYTDIKSPITGRAGRAAVSPGNLVGPDSGVLATVVNEDPVQILFSVTQRQLLDARRDASPGKHSVRVRLADGSLYKESGQIDFLDVRADPKTDGQLIRTTLRNPDRILTDGQTVRVVIETAADKKSIVIPQPAVAIDQTGPYVFVVNRDDVVEQRRVQLGAARDGLIVVKEGVAAGERVIVQGQQRVRPGMKVTPQVETSIRG